MLCHQKNTKTQSLFFRLINAVRKPELTRHLVPPRSRELGRVQVSCSLRHHLQDWCDLSEAMWPLSHASCLHDLNLTSPVIIVEQIQYWVFISHNHKKKISTKYDKLTLSVQNEHIFQILLEQTQNFYQLKSWHSGTKCSCVWISVFTYCQGKWPVFSVRMRMKIQISIRFLLEEQKGTRGDWIQWLRSS